MSIDKDLLDQLMAGRSPIWLSSRPSLSPDREVSATSARYSRIESSTTVKPRKLRPLFSASDTKPRPSAGSADRTP